MTRGLAASDICRVAGLVAVGLLQGQWFLQPVPIAAKCLIGLALAASLARPATGLFVFAGLAPVSIFVANYCGGGQGLGPQLLEQMALAAGAGALARRLRPDTRTRLGAPALMVAVVAIASAVATLPALSGPLARGVADGLQLQDLRLGYPLPSSPVWVPLSAALVVAECALLGWAVERLLRMTPHLAMPLVATSLAGHAAAGALNFEALVGAAVRTGDVVEALPRLLNTFRISMQTDVHAAASSLLLPAIAGLALLGRSWARNLIVVVLLAAVAMGLWITGSRVAIVLAPLTAFITIGWLVGRGRRWSRRGLVGVAVIAVLIGLGLTLSLRQTNRHGTIAHSASARVILFETGLRMFAENPTFGIGLTRFMLESPRFIAGRLGENYRENAHNNFLQTLAEQGLVGLCVMLWWLAVVVVGGVRAQAANPTADRGCLIAAILACIGTWLTGHPLLVPEFAFVFWLYCGMLTAQTPAPAVRSSSRRWWLPMVIVAVLATIPWRALALRNAIDLEHRGFDLSLWQHDDSQRYREARASFALYLQATGRPVEIPVRRAPGAPDPTVLDAFVAGAKVGTVSVAGAAWQNFTVMLPAGRRRFELVEFKVRRPEPAGPAGVLLRVGKTTAR